MTGLLNTRLRVGEWDVHGRLAHAGVYTRTDGLVGEINVHDVYGGLDFGKHVGVQNLGTHLPATNLNHH